MVTVGPVVATADFFIVFIFTDRPMSDSKEKCRQYNVEYLKYGFIEANLPCTNNIWVKDNSISF
jgi:hypothetical protein